MAIPNKQNNTSQNEIVLKTDIFDGQGIRKIFHQKKWYFSVIDVVKVLTESVNPKEYIKKMRSRDETLSVNWGTICTPLEVISKDGKKRAENMAEIKGILRIIQSISSPKAEPFKLWLAKVGQERIEEIENPELAMDRMKLIYEKKGYPKEWIEKRSRGIATRHTLTDEWRARGAKKGLEYAILTNEIMDGTFGLKVADYKKLKGLEQENLRDHMNELELILTMLGEAATTEFSVTRDSQGFTSLKKDAGDGGEIAGRTRKNIEKKSGKKIINSNNYLLK